MLQEYASLRFVVVLAVLHCLAFIDRTLINGVLPLLRTSVAMSDAQAGWIMGTAFALPYGATALAVAALRRGRPASTGWLIGGVLVWTAGSLATGFAASLTGLTVARAMLGIGQGLFVPFAIARLLEGTRPAQRGRALGLFVAGATFGRSTALLTVGATLSILALAVRPDGVAPWRLLYVVTAIPNVAVLVALALMTRLVPALEEDAATAPVPWRALLPFFPMAIAPVIFAQAILAWLPTLFVRERGFATTDAAWLIGTVTIVAAPTGPILAGWLTGRYAAWQPRTPELVLAALAVTLLPLALLIGASGTVAAVAAMAVMLVTLGMASFGGLFGVQLLTPPNARVGVNAVFLALVTVVGVGLGPLVAGALASFAGGSGGSLGGALLMTGSLATAICAVAVVGARGAFRHGVRP